MITLSKAFATAFGELKFDQKLGKQLELYRAGLLTRNGNMMEFFGSNLLGTHRIWFKDQYTNDFYDGILNIPYDVMKAEVRKATTINHTYKISGDIMNLTLMYMIHRFMRAPGLSEKQREHAMYDLAMIFFYRCFCIIISDQFDFTADPKVAQQAYANLSMKFLIKKLGTWNRVIDYRSKALINKKDSIHWDALYTFDDDDDIVYAINDSQGRIKGIIKEYYSELVIVSAGGGSIAVKSAVGIDMEGEEALREKTPGPEVYVLYLRSILLDKHTFIRDDLLTVVSNTNSNTSKRSVREVLEYMSVQSMDAKIFKQVDDFISRTMVLCVYYMDNNIEYQRRRDYVYIVKTLKDMFLSTRSADEDLIKVREMGQAIVQAALLPPDPPGTPKSKKRTLSDSLMKSTRTAVILYLCLCAMSGSK